MARLSREESRALTQAKLLASARVVVAREGYENASIDRIAEEAGFSKGAFYSNFDSKEEIVLELLESHSLQDVSEIARLLGDSRDPIHMIEVIAEWSHARSNDPSWGLLALELFRRARRDKTYDDRHSNLFREQWRGLGEILLSLFAPGQAPADAETLGGVVMELTYSAASSFKAGPNSGDMVRLFLTSLLRAYGRSADQTNGLKAPAAASKKALAAPGRGAARGDSPRAPARTRTPPGRKAATR